ncbi:sugar phosphate isomerase/epimerase [Novosphingobium sp. 9U]|uniref:sugar phosphate isomerase/epimerase family protein n=1 Tax=Novosphingobium sp. 9U TaxID=2653158 RepID=UPI0012F3E1BA|nr:sugar phosphate isomerase/epimerase family protein [Novosphingobium sp. 9U]VWX51839.1 conserved hypothetical protein [Novosphingobium sp. 9U]
MSGTVHPRVSVSLISAGRWPLAQSLEYLASLGVGAISVTGSQLAAGAEAVSQILASGMQVVSVGTGGLSLIDTPELTLDRLTPVIEAAADLGSPCAFAPSGPTPALMPSDDGFARLIACLPTADAAARERGVRLAIENSSIATRQLGFVHTLADACWLAEEADVGVVVELQNCWYERGLPRLFATHHDRFAIVNVSDFLLGEELKFNRRVPGDGSIPLEWLLAHLLDAGYGGYFDLEYLGPAIEQEGYASAIARGVTWLSERLEGWGV